MFRFLSDKFGIVVIISFEHKDIIFRRLSIRQEYRHLDEFILEDFPLQLVGDGGAN